MRGEAASTRTDMKRNTTYSETDLNASVENGFIHIFRSTKFVGHGMGGASVSSTAILRIA